MGFKKYIFFNFNTVKLFPEVQILNFSCLFLESLWNPSKLDNQMAFIFYSKHTYLQCYPSKIWWSTFWLFTLFFTANGCVVGNWFEIWSDGARNPGSTGSVSSSLSFPLYSSLSWPCSYWLFPSFVEVSVTSPPSTLVC